MDGGVDGKSGASDQHWFWCVHRESSTLRKLFCRQPAGLSHWRCIKGKKKLALNPSRLPPACSRCATTSRKVKKAIFKAPAQSLSLCITFSPGSIALPVYILAFFFQISPLFPTLSLSLSLSLSLGNQQHATRLWFLLTEGCFNTGWACGT